MDVDNTLKAKVAAIAKKFGLTLIVLFGSQVSGKTHPESDVDLAVKGKETLNLERILEITGAFSELFSKEVDLVDIRKASPLLLGVISANSIALYEGEESAYNIFYLSARNQYLDYMPYLRKQADLNKEAIDKLS